MTRPKTRKSRNRRLSRVRSVKRSRRNLHSVRILTKGPRPHYRSGYLKDRWSGTKRSSYTYSVDVAPSDRSTCKGCNKKIALGTVRLGRSTPNPFDASGGATDYTKYFHPEHGFSTFLKSRCVTKVPTKMTDLAGLSKVSSQEQAKIKRELSKFTAKWEQKCAKQ